MTDWFLPRHVTQRTGTPCQFSNCWAAIGAWCHHAATGGTASVTPEEFKAAAGGGSGGKNKVTGCSKGLETDIIAGLRKLGIDQAKLVRGVSVADAKKIFSQERRAVYAVATDYDVWPVAKDCMNGTAGPDVNHMVGVICGGTMLTIENPLCTDYQQVGIDKVLAAANKYAKQNGRSGLTLIRVPRPIPVTAVGDKRRIVELEAELQNAREDLIEVNSILATATAITAPYA